MNMSGQIAGVLHKIFYQATLYSETGQVLTACRAVLRLKGLYTNIWIEDLPPSSIVFSLVFGLISTGLNLWAVKIAGYSKIPNRVDLAHFMMLVASYSANTSDLFAQ